MPELFHQPLTCPCTMRQTHLEHHLYSLLDSAFQRALESCEAGRPSEAQCLAALNAVVDEAAFGLGSSHGREEPAEVTVGGLVGRVFSEATAWIAEQRRASSSPLERALRERGWSSAEVSPDHAEVTIWIVRTGGVKSSPLTVRLAPAFGAAERARA